MDKTCKLTIYFEEPFWVGVFEVKSGEVLEVAKITFGAEPRDPEVYNFILKKWKDLRFSPPIAYDKGLDKKINPKRIQRAINKEFSNKGTATKSQEALKLQHEETVLKRKEFKKLKQEEKKEKKFKIKQQKKKEKHRGK